MIAAFIERRTRKEQPFSERISFPFTKRMKLSLFVWISADEGVPLLLAKYFQAEWRPSFLLEFNWSIQSIVNCYEFMNVLFLFSSLAETWL